MYRWLVLTLVFSLINVLISAHEFWMEPDKFYYQTGAEARISFRVGENFIGEPWKINPSRIVRFHHYFGSKQSDLSNGLTNQNPEEPITLPLTQEGSHVVVMETNPTYIKLDGKQFMEYLAEDGLDEVLYQRQKSGISADSAGEFYSRHTKLMLHAGSSMDDGYKKQYGLPIEIIPDKSPAAMQKGDPVSFKVLFAGKPLFGAKVKVWNRYNNRTSVQNIFSQQDGVIETHISNPGVWMVSVVKMVSSTDPKAQYRSYWGTLVFGVRP